jgi:hypothetical protein
MSCADALLRATCLMFWLHCVIVAVGCLFYCDKTKVLLKFPNVSSLLITVSSSVCRSSGRSDSHVRSSSSILRPVHVVDRVALGHITSTVPWRSHSSNAPYSFIHLKPTLYKQAYWKHCFKNTLQIIISDSEKDCQLWMRREMAAWQDLLILSWN